MKKIIYLSTMLLVFSVFISKNLDCQNTFEIETTNINDWELMASNHSVKVYASKSKKDGVVVKFVNETSTQQDFTFSLEYKNNLMIITEDEMAEINVSLMSGKSKIIDLSNYFSYNEDSLKPLTINMN